MSIRSGCKLDDKHVSLHVTNQYKPVQLVNTAATHVHLFYIYRVWEVGRALVESVIRTTSQVQNTIYCPTKTPMSDGISGNRNIPCRNAGTPFGGLRAHDVIAASRRRHLGRQVATHWCLIIYYMTSMVVPRSGCTYDDEQ